MGTLAAALAWAARGFRVFPLEEGGKLPIDVGWTSTATTDPEIIKRWWVDPVIGVERNYNVGCLTSEWIVPDIDIKEDKPGLKTMYELGLDFDTLTTSTPSGGYHLFYTKPDDNPVGQSPLGNGVDLRSHNGYVVAPGSRLANGGVYRIAIDLAPIAFPEHLRGRLYPPRARSERQLAPDIDLDQPEFIEMGAHWLRTAAPKAVEGLNGDDTTYRVACRLRDFGLSSDVAISLLVEHWNEGCEPPWPLEELKRKVENAYEYATGFPGTATARGSFDNVAVVEPPSSINTKRRNGEPYHFGNLLGVGEIVNRPWVLGTLLLNRSVTTLVAGPGAGKSILKLIVAAHLAVGKDFLGHKCYRAGKSICFDAEDDIPEQSRRLNAICTMFGFDIETVRKNVALVSSDEVLLQLTTSGSAPVINREAVEKLLRVIKDPEVVMLALGPLSELHASNENDNIVMRYIMGVLRLIAREGDVAVLVDHHTAKPPLASSETWVGSQFAGRGASSIPAAARCALTMFSASSEDCVEIGVPAKDRAQYVRLDTGKMSYAKQAKTEWLKWEGVRLWNGDEVGVLAPFNVKDVISTVGSVMASQLIGELRKNGSASMTLEQTIAVMMRDPLIAKEGKATARNRLERILAEPIRIEGVELSLVRGVKGIEGVAIR